MTDFRPYNLYFVYIAKNEKLDCSFLLFYFHSLRRIAVDEPRSLEIHVSVVFQYELKHKERIFSVSDCYVFKQH